MYLWGLGHQMMWHLHGVVEEVEYLSQFPLVGCQNFGNGRDDVLDLIGFEAELNFAHLEWQGTYVH